MAGTTDARVAAQRLRFLTEGRAENGTVRNPILASWRRSAEHAVAADRVQPPYVGDLDLEKPLVRAAEPALRALCEAVSGQPLSIVLADPDGLVMARLTADAQLERRLDRAMLAPGFRYAEGTVGTNGIGTALEMGGPAAVLGHEHYAENLEDLACAAVPVAHPVTGRALGLVNLTTWRKDAGPLLLPLARTAAQQVQAALRDVADAAERALLREYLRLERRTAGVVLAVGEGVTVLSDRARGLLDEPGREALLAAAAEASGARRSGPRRVVLPDGRAVRLHCRVVESGGRVAGVVASVGSHHLLVRPAAAGGGPARQRAEGTVERTVGDTAASPRLQDLEREAIVRALRAADGDRAAAAEALGMSRATIYRRIRAYRILD